MKTFCDPSQEPSQGDGTREGSEFMLLWRNMDNYPSIIPVIPSHPEY